MKKLLCCLLAALWTGLFLLPVSAAGGSLSLSAVKNGGSVFVTVSANQMYVTSAQLLVQFNSELLTFTEGVGVTGQQDGETDVRLRHGSSDTVLINCASLQTMTGDLVRLSFTVKENAAGRAADFSLAIRTLYLSQSPTGAVTESAVVPCRGATVSLGGGGAPEEVYFSGDVDMDGNVTPADARLALRTSVRLETLNAISFLLADTDGDGSVSAADARRILRASVNLETL